MERNTKTTFSALKSDDRFYKANDKKKRVFEKYLKFIMSRNTHKEMALDTATKASLEMRSDTEVIFLRHKTN